MSCPITIVFGYLLTVFTLSVTKLYAGHEPMKVIIETYQTLGWTILKACVSYMRVIRQVKETLSVMYK